MCVKAHGLRYDPLPRETWGILPNTCCLDLEMNMHVPQSLQTRYELEWITLVPTQIFHPQGGQGIIALNGFDAVTGMYRFTSSDTPLTKDKVQNLLMVVPFWDGTYEEKDMEDGTMWSPAALYSMSLPKFSYKGKNMSYNDNPVEANEVVIKKGKVRKGSVFDGKVLGGSQDAMMKSLAFWYGNWAAKNYIDNTQQLMNEWLASSGMSIGIGDCLTPLDLMGQIKDEVQKGIDNVNQILTQAHHGLFESNLQSDYFFKILELKVKNALTDIDTRVTKLLKKEINPADNRFLQMVACGGRGKFPNFAQSIGIVGQQDTYGSRIHFHFTNRTLPHFTKDDYGAESRGFIIHSFGQGLDPHEYFFVQMAGRNGTIDTAIKSVSADTKILIIENDKPKYTEIGDWIDGLLEVNKDNVERLTEKEQELLQLKQKTLIPTTDSKGNVSWGEITAVTRHDPGEGMFEVKTQSGRSVKVVESKSLIVWDNDTNSFKEVLTSEIKIGDFLPVTMCIPKPSASSTLYTDKETGFKLANDIFIKNNVIPSEIYIASNEFIHGFLSAINLNDCFTEEIANTIVYLYNRIGVFVCIHQQEFNKFKIQVAESKVICNNVVLDPIIEINKLPVENYPKVYDVTVPSTLNFGLANGLQVRDTADVGYIQRRLIKAMEDISVMYDLTVRSAAKTIIQFRYGDDGYDGMTLQKQKLELFEKTSTQLRADYEIAEVDWSAWEKMLVGETKKLWKTKSVQEKEVAQKAFQELVESQETLRGKDYRFVNSIDFCSTLNCPVHFDRLMTKVRDFYPVGGAIELFPSDVVQAHNELANELTKFMPDFTLNRFIIQLKSTVSVKRIVIKERWSRAAFTECMRQVREYFMKGLCQPGEMIGTLTAELLGEPLTQMTLNSVDWNTEVLFKMNGRIMKKQIGEWIDEVLPLCSKIENHPNDTVLGYIDTLDVQVPACTENGMIIWDKVQAVTRHPVINPDGSNTLIKVMTRSGREVIATKAKSFLKRVQNKIVGVDGAELKVGDYIPFSKVLDIEEIALSDFSSVVAEYNYLEDYDVIPDVELSSGVQTIYRKNLDKLIMNTKNEDDIQILKSIKRENIYYDEIIEIEEIPSSHQYVYDLTVEKTKNFNIANGLCMRDTFHAAGRADAGLVTTSGVPRMKEIVNLAGKQKQKQIKTPSMKIYLKEPWRSDLNKAKELKPILEFTKLGDLVSQTKILFDPVQNVFSTSPKRPSGVDFEEEDEFTRLYYSFTEAVGYQAPDPSNISPWVLRMEFNRDKMVAHNITMADIRRVLTSNEEINQEITISFSDDNAGELVMRVRVNSIQDDTDPVSFLQLLEHKNLMQVTIQGVPGIIRAFPQKEDTLYYNADGKPEMRSDWIIETEGVNIFEVLMLEFVDAERMMCNDINMIKEIFGIEAARAILIYEFGNLMSGSVPDLNYRHISVVCDVMSYRGDLMSIDRHGLKRSPDISAFAKASNEESVEILVNAGIFADNDRMTGVSSNILMGQQPTGGTNAFELLLDESDLGAGMVEVGVPDYRPSTIYEEVGEATTWGADDDVVEEVVEAAHPEYQGFMGDDPFAVQFEGDRLDRLGRLEVETSVPRPPLFKSTKNWIHMDE